MAMRTILFALIFCASLPGCAQDRTDRPVGGGCEDCQLMFTGMPSSIESDVTITKPGEAGDPMVISGTIFKKDGKTPAPNVVLYVYHTDNTGEYTHGASENESTRHGRLRAWIKSDARGNYKFTTIRPASYPNSRNPQHIHPIIKEPGLQPYWIDEYLFEDDPYVDAKVRAQQEGRGGKGIIRLTKNGEGVWTGKRDIVLGKNVEGYE